MALGKRFHDCSAWLKANIRAIFVFVLCIPATLVPQYLLNNHLNPPVSVYIAIMGLLAAVATFMEPRKAEKAAWIALLTLLVVAEIRNLYVADAEQLAKFERISNALDSTKKGLDDAAARLGGLSGDIKDAAEKSQGQFGTMMSEMTGGNSYIYMEPLQIIGPMEVQIPGFAHRPVMEAMTVPKFVGTYPLQNVRVYVDDPIGRSDVWYGTMYPGRLGGPVQSPVLRIRPEFERQHTGISINCSNGTYLQLVLFINLDGKWVWASRLYKGAGEKRQLIREWAEPNFPKSRLSDWDKSDEKRTN